MRPFRIARIGLLLATISLNLAPVLSGVAGTARAADGAAAAPASDTVRPEIFKLIEPGPIKQLLAARNFKEIQNRIEQAEALPARTPFENYMLNRMRVVLATASDNGALAIPALEAVLASGRPERAERSDFMQLLASYQYNAKNYSQAIVWFQRYLDEGGDQQKARPNIIRAYYLNNEFDKAKQALLLDLQHADKAGRQPAIEDLQLLANSGAKTRDMATFLLAMEKLVQFYPSDDYWIDLLSRTQGKPGYSNRFQLDMLRLEYAAVKTMTPGDYADLAELALQAAFPAEAKKAMEAGYAAGVLGSGQNAGHHKQLREKAARSAADDARNIGAGEAGAAKARDGTGLFNLGYAYVTMEQFDKGIDLMQKGIAKGGLKRPDDARLRLGYAYALAGRKDEALATLQALQGGDGLGDLARYWTLWLRRPAPQAAQAAQSQRQSQRQ